MEVGNKDAIERSLCPLSNTHHLHSQAVERSGSVAKTRRSRAESTKFVKPRASQACQSCRARKVRCDVAKHGVPCVHCKLDEIECVLSESKRRRKRTTLDRSPASKRDTLPSSAKVLHPARAAHEPSYQLGQHVPDPSARQGSELQDMSFHNDDQRTMLSPMLVMSPNVFNLHQFVPQGVALPNVVPLSHTPTSPAAIALPVLPTYIKPLPFRFGYDDITYLQNKGALLIPDLELRNELLRVYAEYTHPFMPLLEWHKFVQIIIQDDGMQSVSLLLFQAVMFSGTATVDLRLLKAAGYNTRREARRAFFEKARLLYDLDYEDDSIALVQALLLMTYWREDPNGRKETHYWIEIAVSLSQKLGLHHNPEASVTWDSEHRKLRKRIWWSAYMRDSQIALGTRKPTLMKDVDFDVPMLELADFELDRVPYNSDYIPADWKFMRDEEKQRQLASMCIEMAKLCLCLSYILSMQYKVTGSKGSARTTRMLFNKTYEPGGNQIQAGAKALQEWKDRLPTAHHITPILYDMDSGNSCLVVNCSFLHMVYYAILSSLHRSQVPRSTGLLPPAAHSTKSESSREAIRLAASQITTIASTLCDLGLVCYLPSPSITVLLPAIVSSLADVLAPGEFLREESLQNFNTCMQIMAALRDMYAAADYSTVFLQIAIQSTGIGPMTLQTYADRGHHGTTTSAQGLSAAGPQVLSAAPSPGRNQLALPTSQVMDTQGLSHNYDDSISDGRRLNCLPVPGSSATGRRFDQGQHANRFVNYSDSLVPGPVEVADDATASSLTCSSGATIIDHLNDFELGFARARKSSPVRRTISTGENASGMVQATSGGVLLDEDWLMDLGMEESLSVGEETGSASF